MFVQRNRGDRLGVFCLGVKGAALAALGEIVVLRTPFGAVDKGLNEGESTFNRLALEHFMSHNSTLFNYKVAWRVHQPVFHGLVWIGLQAVHVMIESTPFVFVTAMAVYSYISTQRIL